MKKVIISEKTRKILEAHARFGRLKGAIPVGDKWEVELQDEVYDRLVSIDSDPDKAIEIATSHATSGRLQ